MENLKFLRDFIRTPFVENCTKKNSRQNNEQLKKHFQNTDGIILYGPHVTTEELYTSLGDIRYGQVTNGYFLMLIYLYNLDTLGNVKPFKLSILSFLRFNYINFS